MSEEWSDELEAPRRQLVAFAVSVEGGMGIVAWVAGVLIGLPVAGWVVWSATGVGWGLAGALLMLGLLFGSRALRWESFERLHRLVDHLVKTLFGACRWWELLLIAVLAGWGEELLFRGLIQGGLHQLLDGWLADGPGWLPAAAALVIASVLFGFAHCLSREYVVFASTVGLLLGGMTLATGNLLAAIVAHALYDFVALMWLVRRSAGNMA